MFSNVYVIYSKYTSSNGKCISQSILNDIYATFLQMFSNPAYQLLTKSRGQKCKLKGMSSPPSLGEL